MSKRKQPAVPKLSEKEWQAQVVQLAVMCGFRAYHTHDSRNSEPGFLDLVLMGPVRPERQPPRRLIYIETKVPPNKLTADQEWWLAALREAGQEAYCFYPEQWNEVVQIITEGRAIQ